MIIDFVIFPEQNRIITVQICKLFHLYKQHILFQMKSIQVRLVGRFRLEKKIQGEHERLLYSAVHTQNDTIIFLKGDQIKKKFPPQKLSILQEGKILQTMQGGIGIPHMYWCGTEEDYNFIVIEELSANLQQLITKCNMKFSLKTTLMLGFQIISILQYFHFKNFIHCSLKPEHLMIGSGSKYGKLYIIDYSSAVRYRDAQTLEHITDTPDKKVDERNYNMQFSSINYHRGNVPSRKDDIISLLYILAYFMKGSLPWSEIFHQKKNQRQKSREILQMKQSLEPKFIFEGCPDLLRMYEMTDKLKFEEKPLYSYYKNVFQQRMEREGYLEDGIYDWMLIQEGQNEQFDDFDFDLEIIPNEKDFLKVLEEQMKNKEKEELQKIILEKKKVQLQKTSGKDKDCVIF